MTDRFRFASLFSSATTVTLSRPRQGGYRQEIPPRDYYGASPDYSSAPRRGTVPLARPCDAPRSLSRPPGQRSSGPAHAKEAEIVVFLARRSRRAVRARVRCARARARAARQVTARGRARRDGPRPARRREPARRSSAARRRYDARSAEHAPPPSAGAGGSYRTGRGRAPAPRS